MSRIFSKGRVVATPTALSLDPPLTYNLCPYYFIGIFTRELLKSPKAVNHYCKYLQQHYEYKELAQFLRYLKIYLQMTKMTHTQNAQKTSNVQLPNQFPTTKHASVKTYAQTPNAGSEKESISPLASAFSKCVNISPNIARPAPLTIGISVLVQAISARSRRQSSHAHPVLNGAPNTVRVKVTNVISIALIS